MSNTIDLTPTAEGFLAIGATFAAQIISDVKRDRINADTAILRSLLDIAYSAGQNAGMDNRESGDFTSNNDDVLNALLSRCPRGPVKE